MLHGGEKFINSSTYALYEHGHKTHIIFFHSGCFSSFCFSFVSHHWGIHSDVCTRFLSDACRCTHPCLYSTPSSPVYRGTFSVFARGEVCESVCLVWGGGNSASQTNSPSPSPRNSSPRLTRQRRHYFYNLISSTSRSRVAERKRGEGKGGEKGERAHGRKSAPQQAKNPNKNQARRNVKKKKKKKKREEADIIFPPRTLGVISQT